MFLLGETRYQRAYGMPYGSGEFRVAVELPRAAATRHFELTAVTP